MPDVLKPKGDAKTTVDAALATIRETLENMRFGSIALTVHDGRVVQLEVTEKRRLAS